MEPVAEPCPKREMRHLFIFGRIDDPNFIAVCGEPRNGRTLYPVDLRDPGIRDTPNLCPECARLALGHPADEGASGK
jgi:hypothetical protein